MVLNVYNYNRNVHNILKFNHVILIHKMKNVFGKITNVLILLVIGFLKIVILLLMKIVIIIHPKDVLFWKVLLDVFQCHLIVVY